MSTSRTVALLLGAVTSLAIACTPAIPTAAPPGSGATPPAIAESTTTPPDPVFDQQFIDMMVPHHEGAVEMAKIALARGSRPEITTMAEDILTSQAAEIAQMKTWRQTWFGSDETPPMHLMPMLATTPTSGDGMPHTMDMAKDVENLRSAADPFDRAFIDAMIPHHQDAVDAALVALQRADRREIQQLASAIMDAQLREIGMMQTWRTRWFGSSGTADLAPARPQIPIEVPDEHVGH